MTNDNIPVPDPTTLTTAQLYREIHTLRELIEKSLNSADSLSLEKFAGRDLALTAALAAASAAVAKSEAFTTKQIEAIGIRIEDLKERLDRGDGSVLGRNFGRTMGDRAANFIFAIIGAITGIAGLIIALTVFFRH